MKASGSDLRCGGISENLRALQVSPGPRNTAGRLRLPQNSTQNQLVLSANSTEFTGRGEQTGHTGPASGEGWSGRPCKERGR